MAFQSVDRAKIAVDAVARSAEMVVIADDLDDLNLRLGGFESSCLSDIRDDFSAAVIDTIVTWDKDSTGTIVADATIGTSYSSAVSFIINAQNARTCVRAKTNKIRWDISQAGTGGDRIVVMEFRIRGVGTGADRGMLIGGQDSALSGNSLFTDIDQMIGVYLKNNGFWTVRTANGSATEIQDVCASDEWHTFRLTVTCSPTSGLRKVLAELDGAVLGGGPITSNLPTASLMPMCGSVVTSIGTSTATFHVDYFLAYNGNRPLSPS